MAICRNCGYTADCCFCPECGQSTAVKRLELLALLRELPNVLWNLDRGILYNLVQLTIRPGYAIKDYLDGKRRRFYHPLAYMLVVLAVMLVAMNFMNVHYYDAHQDAWMTAEQAAFWKEYDATQQAWVRFYKFYIPFYLPWMALLWYAWLRAMKQAYTIAESICISFFVSAQMTVPQVLVLTLAWLVGSASFTRISDQAINWPIMFVLWGLQFYQLGNPELRTPRRVLLAALGALLMFGFSLSMIYLFLGFARIVGL